MPDLDWPKLIITFIAGWIIIYCCILYWRHIEATYGDNLDEDNE